MSRHTCAAIALPTAHALRAFWLSRLSVLFDDGKWLEPYVVGYEPLKPVRSPWHPQGFELECHCEVTGWLPISAKELSAAGFNDDQVAALLEMSRRWRAHRGIK